MSQHRIGLTGSFFLAWPGRASPPTLELWWARSPFDGTEHQQRKVVTPKRSEGWWHRSWTYI